ncbi:autotransporter outer membrane beta-barrel domain-containing protein [Caulobacter mirabilis]|uniref:Autotransporter domain-containing protein n=1 Tax=Caulobacter mirabilis TaxID=69666 RepID=A0A2D2AUK3_9CAUL|nr:autotransporter outer membrane beta-barrel domain-containing protein [Caulobacter mirabilis]ATQ41671.1 autotransporter domain-containing protein [Caulobacter mirabilis]
MFRKRLVATAAAAPMLLFAGAALAETTISDTRTSGVATGSIGTGGAADDIKIASAGKVKPTASGPAVTVNSNHKVVNEGEISTSDVNNSTGIQVNAGVTTTVTNKGVIRLDETYEAKDTDNDGDLDGKFATGAGRYGIRVMPGGTVTGDIINDTGGGITIEGNNSAGISVESNLTGNLINRGSISVTGDNARGVQVLGDVSGNVDLRGAIGALGENATGAAIDGDVGGKLIIQGSIASTGYRYTSRPADKAVRDKLDADDKLQGGPAVRIAGNVGGGILLDRPPVAGVDYDGDGIPNDKDDDDDNDGKKDTEDKDLDNDGIDDSLEGTASIVQNGGAPALLIGSDTQSITINPVGTGADQRGLVIRGSIVANGVYDDVDATGVQIGTTPTSAFTTDIKGGIRVQGSITAASFNGEAKGIYLSQGAIADRIDLEGNLLAAVTATSKSLADESSKGATALLIGKGAVTNSVYNSGIIGAIVNGEKGDAVAIRDQEGNLSFVQNTGKITAVINPTDDADDKDDADNDPSNETVTGKAIAIDVAAAKQGVRVRQYGVNDGDDDLDNTTKDPDADGDGVDDADEPAMVGNIKFSAFNDTFDLENGTYKGDIDFGAGNDVYNVGTTTTGAEAIGAIRNSADGLTVNVNKGKLTITNAEVINGTAVNIGAGASVIFTVDPTTNANTRFNVTSASIADGAKLGLTVTDLISGPQTYTVIKTAPGGLTAGNIDQSLLGNSPYLFVAKATANTSAGEVNIELRRRTSSEMSLTVNQSAALDAVYAALGKDNKVRDAFLGAETREDFLKLYDQMLPDQGEGLFSSLDMLTRTVSRLTATRPDLKQRYGPDSFWIQEVNVQVMRETGVTIGSDTKAFGFVGGYEAMGADGGALGATLAFVNAEEKDDVAQVGEQTNISLLEAGIYWRRSIGKFTINARGAGGYAWLSGDRVFIDPKTNLIERASADWNGFTGVASLSASYEQEIGRFYMRPTVSLDYLYLREGERKEGGKSNAIKLEVDERTSSRLSAMAELAFGATFGRDLWWRPEVRVGYRQHLAGEVGDTVFRFVGGQPVTLVATEPGDGAVVIGLSLKAGTAMSYVALEGEYESADGEDRYNLQLAGRVMF